MSMSNHFEGCWWVMSHHACTLARVSELEAENNALRWQERAPGTPTYDELEAQRDRALDLAEQAQSQAVRAADAADVHQRSATESGKELCRVRTRAERAEAEVKRLQGLYYRTDDELAALKYQLDLACVDVSIYLGYLREYDKDERSGSSSAVHADLERRWAERGTK